VFLTYDDPPDLGQGIAQQCGIDLAGQFFGDGHVDIPPNEMPGHTAGRLRIS
jgi:hypothetical protein